MLLAITRHGESEADILNVHEGRADFELTERGHRQAAAMAKFMKENYTVSAILSSTLKRAKQTALHLSGETGVPVAYDENLMEFNNGMLAGLPYEEAARRYPPVKDLPCDQAVYGQESKLAFRRRAEEVLKKALAFPDKGGLLVLVTHGGMIDQLYRAALKLPVVTDAFFSTADTGIHLWETDGKRIRIVFSNRDGHARGL
ncbi:MAG: histidine phosphatase family protein [Clostridia bacterium]|nr:histidine phosphatase family protein [Clostridia bacterium]